MYFKKLLPYLIFLPTLAFSKVNVITTTTDLEWAVKSLLNWRQDTHREDIIHINGDRDKVFPINNISNCIILKGGRHEMIILRAKWFNENLIKLIEKV